MRSRYRLWLPALGLATFLVAVPAWSPISAQFRGETGVGLPGGFGGAGAAKPAAAGPADAAKVYYREPITLEAASTHVALGKRLDFLFPNETPLDEFLHYITESSQDKATLPQGINIYVDQVALLQAERTLQSPISISLRSVPSSTALDLALPQLELTWFVRADGILVITHKDSPLYASTPTLGTLLDEVRALRAEVAALKDAGQGPR